MKQLLWQSQKLVLATLYYEGQRPKGECSFCFLMKLQRFILYFDLRAAE